jgi:hypothetical protein
MKILPNRLNQMKQELQRFPEWANVYLGLTAFNDLKDRIVNNGIAFDNRSFKPYSTKPTLVGAKSFYPPSFGASVFSSKKKRKEMQWVTYKGHRLAVLPGGYRQIREMESREAGHKTFLRSGQMWLNTGLIGTKQEGNGHFITTVGTLNEKAQMKLDGNSAREGKDLLKLNAFEEKKLDNMFDKYLTDMLNRAING